MIATFSVLVWVVGSHAWWVRTRLPIMSSSRLKFIFTLCLVAGTWENATPSEIPHKHTNYLFKSCNLLLCHFSFWTNHCTRAGNTAALPVCGNEWNPRQQSGMSKPKSHISIPSQKKQLRSRYTNTGVIESESTSRIFILYPAKSFKLFLCEKSILITLCGW